MERTISVEDKIRRAEEIYNRRRENDNRLSQARVRVDNTNSTSNKNVNKRLKKMILQIIVCMLIYFTFFYIVKNDYVFSQDFKNKCEEILSYDISFNEIYKNVSDYIIFIQQEYQKIVNNSTKQEEQPAENEQTEQENSNATENTDKQEETEEQVKEEEQQKTEEQTNEENTADSNIGGMVEQISDTGEAENLSEEEQMKKDAEEIKSKISFIKPLSGVITSVFGWRNPEVSTVSKYHTGIDIAADEGTDIISATSGKVILASSKGAYGNHLKIQVEDVIIIYAHCLKLEVEEGEEIQQGQLIAKVGSTGNSTGPHLHFEIRKENRYVNPDLILEF